MRSHPTPADFPALFFRSALGRFPTGVTVITAEHPDAGTPLGLTISSFSSVSLEPPMVLWTLTHTAASLSAFKKLDRYVIHVLSASQVDLARRFAKGPQAERFTGLALERAPNGTLMLADTHCAAWFECHNTQRHEAGDHTIFVGQVEHCHRQLLSPLIYHAGDFELTPGSEPLSRN
ncbi:flavin reductase family protein [Castellaniella ginsengisoli]|jgi:flavin reductase (DIM6/NTAB) family NADH-FMN oxidoreductase RutF|uniref:Flavin reductase family protein n=1 Tax=Castellaniella ginsengisoli TaxID=546114 RepID=A0AB39GEV5_9BURK